MVVPRHWRAARLAPRILTLTATPISTTQINLSWTTDAGNVGLAGFKIYLNGALAQTMNNPNAGGAVLQSLSSGTTYQLGVAPFDTTGKEYGVVTVAANTAVPASGGVATATTVASSGLAAGNASSTGAGVVVTTQAAAGTATGGSGGSVSNFTTFAVTTPLSGAVPWTFNHAFAQGDVPAGNFVSSSANSFQADVRNTWPDGSVKVAVLSGISPSGAINIGRSTSAPSGTNISEPTPASLGTNISVTFSGAVTGTYTPQTAATNGTVAWNKATPHKVRQSLGPVMSEFHYYVPTTDAHVSVWFVLRVYSDRTEVNTIVENGWLNVASPGERDYVVSVSIGGVTKFSGTVNHLHHTRWSRIDWIGTDPQTTPAHNAAYLRSTKLAPNYAYTSPTSAAFTGLASLINPAPFALGNYVADMGGTGDAQPIGVLPHWEALYCATADSRAYAATISNARSHGRWQVHFRDETTGRPPLHQSYPNTTILSGWGTAPPAASGGTTSGPWDIPHHPSVGYLAYLIEGRWEQLEALQFTAAYNILDANPATRIVSGFGNGIIACINAPHTTRGAAWTWRTVGQAAAISPESLNGVTLSGADLATGDSFRTSVQNTATWMKARYVDGTEGGGIHVNSSGWVGQYDQYGAPDGEATHWWGGGWLHNFQLAALAHISDLGIKNVTAATLNAVRDHAYNHVINLCGTDATWNFRRAGPYAKPYLSNLNPSSPTFLTTAQQFAIYLANNGAGALSSASGQSLKDHDVNTDMASGSSSSDADGYWSYTIANLSTAVEHGKAGAQAAFDLVTAASNYNPAGHGANDNPKWGIRSRTTPPAWATAVAAGQFANVSLNTLASVDPCPTNACPYSGTGTESVFIVWNGGAYAANYGQFGGLGCHGGGHLSYSGNAPFVYDIGAQRWSCIGTPSPFDESQANINGEYPDGRPFPPHTYAGLAYLSPANGGGPKGSLLRFGFAGSGDNEWVHRCDLATGVWSRWSSTFLAGGSYYSACYDASRNRHWYCAGYNSFSSGHGYINSSTGVVTPLPNLGDNVDGANHALGYCPTNDMLLHLGTAGNVIRLAGRLASGSASFQALTTSGTFPPDPAAGLEWSTLLGCFVSYFGNGSATIYKLTPPASNPLTSAWVWTNETLTGIGGATPIVANYTSGFNGQWSRFREVPALGGFIYADGRSNPVQFWRPTIAPLFSFSTNFPLTENPISQGGIWQNGGGNGWQSVQTTPGKAFATGFGGQTFQGSEFDDPIAHLKTSVHAFTPNQYVEGTVYRLAGYSPNTNHEIELHGRQTITSGNAQGYEVLWAHTGEIAVVKWNGPLGNYTAILDNFQIGAAVNGDILRIELRGTVCTVKKNGVTVATVDLTMGGTLTTWNAGQPGMGMWPRGGGNAVLANYGWSSWRAGDL